MDTPEFPDVRREDDVEQRGSGYWVGLRGRLARPFWGWLGAWAVLCGALASNHPLGGAENLLNLLLALLLAELAWGSLWDLAVGTAWFRPLAEGWPLARPAALPSLPYTQPHAPGGRLGRWLNRFAGWWREAFWPATGTALLGLLAVAILMVVLAQLLPDRLQPLYALFVALVGLGLVQRQRGKEPLAAQALLRVGLSWLAGHAALAQVEAGSLFLALSFSLAAWGNLRLAAGLPRGLWLLNAGQALAAIVLVVLKQPLAAGLTGLFLLGQVALQPSLWYSDRPTQSADGKPLSAVVAQRSWLWLMAAMLVAAWALP